MSDLLESLQKASDNVPFTNVAITPVSHLYWGMYDTCITKGEGDSWSLQAGKTGRECEPVWVTPGW